jgi:hypothetical protein
VNYAARGTDVWYYFTVWNLELISIYYFFAMICSIIGFVYKSRENDCIDDRSDGNLNKEGTIWSSSVIAFGQFVHILFEVCGGIFSWIMYNCVCM